MTSLTSVGLGDTRVTAVIHPPVNIIYFDGSGHSSGNFPASSFPIGSVLQIANYSGTVHLLGKWYGLQLSNTTVNGATSLSDHRYIIQRRS